MTLSVTEEDVRGHMTEVDFTHFRHQCFRRFWRFILFSFTNIISDLFAQRNRTDEYSAPKLKSTCSLDKKTVLFVSFSIENVFVCNASFI